ncbi:MAG: response regulator [Dehalococcoidales bacterium]|nr:response regulator [Dehalococcoidales bacterium]
MRAGLSTEARVESAWARPVIMVVDDDEAIRALLAGVLDAEGYRAVEAKDGLEAIELLQRERPDLILLDLKLPRLTGREVLRWLRHTPGGEELAVLVLSANAPRELGGPPVRGFLAKPFDIADLLRSVDVVLGLASGQDAGKPSRAVGRRERTA